MPPKYLRVGEVGCSGFDDQHSLVHTTENIGDHEQRFSHTLLRRIINSHHLIGPEERDGIAMNESRAAHKFQRPVRRLEHKFKLV